MYVLRRQNAIAKLTTEGRM